MLDQELAEQIHTKVAGLVPQPLWIVDSGGRVLAGEPADAGETVVPLSYNEDTIGHIHIDRAASDSSELVPLIKSIVELMTHQHMLMRQMPPQEERVDKLMYDIVMGGADEDTVVAEGKLFGLDLTLPRIALAVIIDDPTITRDNLERSDRDLLISRYKLSLGRAVRSYYTSSQNHLIGYLGQNQFTILKDVSVNGDSEREGLDKFKASLRTIDRIISDEIKQPVTIGVGNYHPGIDGLRKSYDEAMSAAELGVQTWDQHRLYHIDDFGVVAPLLSGVDSSNVSFSRDLLDQLEQQSEMIATLEAFFANNMSMTQTSDQLSIHRNTLVYRLDRISDNLGLDPRKFDDAVQIRLAILFNRFVEDPHEA